MELKIFKDYDELSFAACEEIIRIIKTKTDAILCLATGQSPILTYQLLVEKIIAEKRKNKLILITSHILSDLDDLATDIMYLQEGKLQFCKSIDTLRRETGEPKLGKAIAKIMKNQLQPSSWVDKVLEIKPEDDD